MPDVKLTIPDAWVTEWNVLFVVPSPYGDLRKAADAANAILAEWDYPITMSPWDFLPASIRRWVDPAVIADEEWPDSGYSTAPVDGWVKVYRIDLDDHATDRENRAHDCESCPTCGMHDGRHDKCCGCYDGVCCQDTDRENGGL